MASLMSASPCLLFRMVSALKWQWVCISFRSSSLKMSMIGRRQEVSPILITFFSSLTMWQKKAERLAWKDKLSHVKAGNTAVWWDKQDFSQCFPTASSWRRILPDLPVSLPPFTRVRITKRYFTTFPKEKNEKVFPSAEQMCSAGTQHSNLSQRSQDKNQVILMHQTHSLRFLVSLLLLIDNSVWVLTGMWAKNTLKRVFQWHICSI